jgi:FkbM family methyltransferase
MTRSLRPKTREIEVQLDRSLSVLCLPGSRAEVEFIHQEIFRDDCYLRHAAELDDGDVVVDAGANIGMFALRVLATGKRIHYFGFEPVPAIFRCLEKNLQSAMADHGAEIRLFEQGLSATAGEAEVTFRPLLPGNSTLYSDEQRREVRAMVRSFRLGDAWRFHKGLFFLALPLFPFRNLLTGWWQRLAYRKADRIVCSFTTLERFVRDSGVRRIDLLKIDVEGSEIDVLRGASDDTLRRIRQIVMEISPGNKSEIAGLEARLTGCGFRRIHVESPKAGSDPRIDALPCLLYALSLPENRIQSKERSP